jgi:putative holliday junction resolvase
MKRIAGIDFGCVRIGVALSDETQYLASPLFVLAAEKEFAKTADKLYQALSAHFPLQALVLGLPLHLNGTESPLSSQVRKFASFLEAKFQIPVILWDERLTTAQVERTLKAAELRRKERKLHLDKLSAALILQSYLDSPKK